MSYRRKARLSIDVIEPQVFVPSSDDSLFPTINHIAVPEVCERTPIYTVEVQVKVLWFWIPIWEGRCDYSDADARTKIYAKANQIYESLTEEQI